MSLEDFVWPQNGNLPGHARSDYIPEKRDPRVDDSAKSLDSEKMREAGVEPGTPGEITFVDYHVGEGPDGTNGEKNYDFLPHDGREESIPGCLPGIDFEPD